MASSSIFASSPAPDLGLSVDRNPGARPDATRNLLMLAPDTDQFTYSNFNATRNNQGARAIRTLISQNLAGACMPIPACVINLPQNMEFTDNRLTANDHAGKLFEDIIDLVRELKVKADRWDAYEAGQRLSGNNVQLNDVFSQNSTAATRPYLDEAIHRFIDVRLRTSKYYLLCISVILLPRQKTPECRPLQKTLPDSVFVPFHFPPNIMLTCGTTKSTTQL